MAVQVTLVNFETGPDRARLTWFAPELSSRSITVERRTATAEWETRATVTADGNGTITFEDREIVPGVRYAYRLAYNDGGTWTQSAESWVDIPVHAALALFGVTPNPSAGEGLIRFSLANDEPAVLEVFDVRGRRVHASEASLGAGSHAVSFAKGERLAAGVYTVRVRQGSNSASTRAVVIR